MQKKPWYSIYTTRVGVIFELVDIKINDPIEYNFRRERYNKSITLENPSIGLYLSGGGLISFLVYYDRHANAVIVAKSTARPGEQITPDNLIILAPSHHREPEIPRINYRREDIIGTINQQIKFDIALKANQPNSYPKIFLHLNRSIDFATVEIEHMYYFLVDAALNGMDWYRSLSFPEAHISIMPDGIQELSNDLFETMTAWIDPTKRQDIKPDFIWMYDLEKAEEKFIYNLQLVQQMSTSCADFVDSGWIDDFDSKLNFVGLRFENNFVGFAFFGIINITGTIQGHYNNNINKLKRPIANAVRRDRTKSFIYNLINRQSNAKSQEEEPDDNFDQIAQIFLICASETVNGGILRVGSHILKELEGKMFENPKLMGITLEASLSSVGFFIKMGYIPFVKREREFIMELHETIFSRKSLTNLEDFQSGLEEKYGDSDDEYRRILLYKKNPCRAHDRTDLQKKYFFGESFGES